MSTLRFCAACGAVGVAVALLLSGCARSDHDEVTAPPPPTPVAVITRVTDAAMLETYLKAGIRARTGSVGAFIEGPTAVADGGDGGVGPQAYSGTNLQEAGVDEADRVKTDGQRLYLLHRPPDCCSTDSAVLRIMRLAGAPAAGATQEGVVTLGEGVGADGLYLFSAGAAGALDRLAVVGNRSPSEHDWYTTWSWQNGGVDLSVVDVANPAQPVMGTRLQIDGHLISSRRIGDVLYLVSRYVASVSGYQTYPGTAEAREQNERLLQATPLAALLPHWQVDGADRGELFAADACYLLPVGQEDYSPDLVTLTAIDLRNPTATPKSACLLGPSETLYASTEAIYLATTRYHYQQSGDVVAMSYPADMSTDVHKFALTPAGPVLRGSANIAGHLGWHQDKKPFRFGEYEGVLRVVTSSGAWGGEQVRLTTLAERDGKLVELAHLPNDQRPASIGKPGEQLYAVRFVGNRGFAVTFRTVDPLYVLDLSDPADPFIAGELQIAGYSDYLHPVSETRLLGIGKDAVPVEGEGDGRGAWYQGVKLSLFDISDLAAPSEIDAVVIGQRGTEAGALYDHHALAWLPADPATNRPARLALPVELHDTVAPYTTTDPWGWYGWTHRGLYLFDIESGGITTRGPLVVADNAGASQPADWVAADRAVIAGDAVHYLHAGKVWSAMWGEANSLTIAQ